MPVTGVSTHDVDRSEYALIGRAAALLFLLSLFTGWLLGLVLIGKLAGDQHTLRGAHLAALMGPLFLAAYGWTLPQLRFGAAGRRWLTRGMILSFYANPALNVVRGLLGVSALQPNGEPLNDTLFVAMNLFSGLPAMASAAFWVIGTWGARAPRVETAPTGRGVAAA